MATGAVASLTVTAPGSGYLSAPAVALTGGNGAGATAETIIGSDGTVLAVLLTAAGSGYTSAPTVAFTGGGGTGATAVATLGLPSYATIAQLRAYLTQTTTTVAPDSLLQEVLDAATDICTSSAVGLGFAFAGYAVAARPVLSTHGPYLILPPHAPGTISAVAWGTTPLTAGQDYTILRDGLHETLWRGPILPGSAWPWLSGHGGGAGWGGGYYTVTAAWGYGPPPPAVVEVCREVAVNIWQSRAAGRFSNVIGAADGGAVGYEGALTPLQRSVLAGVRRLYAHDTVTV